MIWNFQAYDPIIKVDRRVVTASPTHYLSGRLSGGMRWLRDTPTANNIFAPCHPACPAPLIDIRGKTELVQIKGVASTNPPICQRANNPPWAGVKQIVFTSLLPTLCPFIWADSTWGLENLDHSSSFVSHTSVNPVARKVTSNYFTLSKLEPNLARIRSLQLSL